MGEKPQTILVVGPGPALRHRVEELSRHYGYRLHYAEDPYAAGFELENTQVDALVCEAAPAYTAECRLVREISQRSVHLPVILFVEPECEEDLYDEIGCASFAVVRPATPLEELHRILQRAMIQRRRPQAA